MSQAKERPILFSGPMVRAILEGRKTVTRRAVSAKLASQFDEPRGHADVQAGYPFVECHDGFHPATQLCPYGQPGDRLWVRETFADIGCRLTYRADLDDGAHCAVKRWIPSLHMRRIDSRILLEVTGVLVERLQDGEGETDFESRYVAEGIHRIHHGDGEHYYHPFKSEPGPGNWSDPFDAWRELWVSINGADSWNANSWVWVVEFKVIEPAPAGCSYHGSHFGAPYPDAQCADGFLWDEDSCDEPGGPLLHGGEIPCPKCNAEAYADHKRQEAQE